MQNGCKIKVGDKKIFLCRSLISVALSTVDGPQSTAGCGEIKFAFHFGLNFDKGLQIAVNGW
jgi:hypothetical protein